MLGLGFRRLKGACEDGDLRVSDNLGHLRMTELLVNHNALDELGVLQLSANLALHLNQIEVDVLGMPAQMRTLHNR